LSEENVELARRGYEAFNRGDLDGLLAMCAPDIVWHHPIDTSAVTGKDAVRAFFETVMDAWQEIRREPEEIIDLGDDRVLVLFRTTARGRASGIAVDARGGDLLTVREGQVLRWHAYTDRAQALEAAKLL
jgi:uncharacterized protein